MFAGCLDWFCPIDETGRKLSASDCSTLTRLRAREWTGLNHYRTVYLKLTIESGKLDTFNRKGMSCFTPVTVLYAIISKSVNSNSGDKLRSVALNVDFLQLVRSNDSVPDVKKAGVYILPLPNFKSI